MEQWEETYQGSQRGGVWSRSEWIMGTPNLLVTPLKVLVDA